jgi:hypothetical protein
MRRITTAIVVLLLMAGMSTVAHAASPTITNARASLGSSLNLNVTFKEVNLPPSVTYNYTATALATATYHCARKPQDGNVETVTALVTGGVTVPVTNGSARGTITVAPPGSGTFSCPNGTIVVLASDSFTGITVSGGGATTPADPSTVTSR